LLFLHARYYDPALGRFISADTIVPEPGNPQDFNRYAYVRNNPLTYTDPTGHFTRDAIVDYLAQTHPGEWRVILAEWEANEKWWATLREAQPDDVFAMSNDEGTRSYGVIQGSVGPEGEVLLGIASTQGIPRAFEEFEIGELQEVDVRMSGEAVGLARLSGGGEYVRYWTPELDWSPTFLNLPTLYLPEVGETLHPWSWYMIGLLWAEAGAAVSTGVEIAEAGFGVGPAAPLVVGSGLVVIGCGAWLGANAWNLSMTPKSTGW
jgi:hypothetical protein